MNIIRKWDNGGFFEDLKKHILDDLKRDPSCGTQKANIRHHIHATLSAIGKLTTNCLSLPVIQRWVVEILNNFFQSTDQSIYIPNNSILLI